MKENNYKRGWEHRPNFRRVRTSFCAAFLPCLLTGVVSAETLPPALHSSVELPVVSHQEETGAVVRSPNQELPALGGSVEIGATTSLELNRTNAQLKDEGAPTPDKIAQADIMPASPASADDGMPGQELKANRAEQQVSTRAGGSMSVVGGDDKLQLPYALVLALMAIIGLVPVSRRNR